MLFLRHDGRKVLMETERYGSWYAHACVKPRRACFYSTRCCTSRKSSPTARLLYLHFNLAGDFFFHLHKAMSDKVQLKGAILKPLESKVNRNTLTTSNKCCYGTPGFNSVQLGASHSSPLILFFLSKKSKKQATLLRIYWQTHTAWGSVVYNSATFVFRDLRCFVFAVRVAMSKM